MADRKDTREKEEKKDEASAAPSPAPIPAAPAPAPAPVQAAPPPKADGKTRAVTVAIWGALAWVFLRLVPQQKIPGVLKGFGSMLWEAAALPILTGVESIKAAARWSQKHGRRAYRISLNLALIAATFFVLGNEFGKHWMIGITLVLTIPLIVFWWTVKRTFVALIHEAVTAVGDGLNIAGKTMAAVLRRIGVVIPEASASDETKGKYFEAIEKYMAKIFLAIIGMLTFLVVDFLKPGWGTVQSLTPIAFLAVIIGFYNAHLKIETDGEVRVMRWGLRLVLWFLAAAFLLPYTASVLTGKSFDRYLGDMLKDQTFGFSAIGVLFAAVVAIIVLWMRVASTSENAVTRDGFIVRNPRHRSRKALAVAGTILIPLTVLFLFWKGDYKVSDLKLKTEDGIAETATKTEPKPKEETPKATVPPTGPTAMTAPSGTPPRLDLPDPVRSDKPDGMPKPYQPPTARTTEDTTPPPAPRRTARDTKPRRYSNFLEADDALKEAGL